MRLVDYCEQFECKECAECEIINCRYKECKYMGNCDICLNNEKCQDYNDMRKFYELD